MKRKLNIATCQFPVSRHIKKNLAFILRQIEYAKQKKAEMVHFSESSLSGYAGIDFYDYAEVDEELLKLSLKQIIDLSAKLKIWVIIGGHHFEGRNRLPYNCLWIIDENGSIVQRYDKRFCTGNAGEEEHSYFKAGKKPRQFMVKGIKCGVLICHEWRYPELYREQHGLGTKILFQSWYDGNLTVKHYKKDGKDLGSLITGTVRGNAANNRLWISASNTSKKESSFASFVVQPNGKILNQLKRNVTGVLVNQIDLSKNFEDPSKPWRGRAMKGILHTEA
jgi:predicted amidohydrolase